MTCKYMYQYSGCNHAELIIQKNGITYYPLCKYDEEHETECPYYEEKHP